MKWKLDSQARLAIMLGAVLAVLTFDAWVLNWSFNNVGEQERWVRHTYGVMSELEKTYSSTKDAETSMRGYLLTGEKEHLAPYVKATLDSLDHAARLKVMTADNPKQAVAAPLLEQLLKRRFALLDEVRAAYRQTGGQLPADAPQFADGLTIMEKLRTQLDEMRDEELTLLDERTKASERSKSIFLWALVVTTLLTAGAILVSFNQISRHQERTRKETEERTAEARKKGLTAQLANALTGDLGLHAAASNVLEFLRVNFKVLAGKVHILERHGLTEVAAFGTEDLGDKKQGLDPSLVKVALQQEDVLYLPDLPDHYWRISSGLGATNPKGLALIPFHFQGRGLGVIELGVMGSLDRDALTTLSGFSDALGVGLNAAQSRAHLQALLEKTQQQSEELQAQQEELRTSNEELEQQARALESQQQALSQKNSELETARTQLEARAEELDRSTKYKSEFLAKMSHELRTPLNGLLILSTLLIENKEGNLTEQQKKFAQSIQSAGNDLLTLINDILDLSKIEARKLNVKADEFPVRDLFDTTKTSFEPQVSSKKLSLEFEASDETRSTLLYTDRQRLEQIVRNFLSNAIKFTEKGSITVKADIENEKKLIRIAVRDTGIGIPAMKQQAIFDAFEQADGSISRKYGGTGLGLTISRELAALLGGRIELTSDEGKGSQFTLLIPLRLPTENESPPSPPQTPRTLPTRSLAADPGHDGVVGADIRLSAQVKDALKDVDRQKRSILIVEDDAPFRSAVVEAVREYGYQPIQASDGELALAILKEHAPSAILLDIKLPGISGLGILEIIKHMPNMRHIPVHMISGLDYQHNALRMGALGYLTKPVTIDKVNSALGRIESLISSKVRRVLLIEDDERQREAISQLISGNDIEVVSQSTGRAAVQLLKTEGFDCIVLDLSLPDVSVFDLIRQLTELQISLPPIVIYTGKDLSDEESQYLRKVSQSIIIKGARSPERLLDEVNLFLHRVESLLPERTRELLTTLRSQEESLEDKTILLVDDDIRNIFALTSALESKGLNVVTARDGVEALEVISGEHKVDLVLMDIMMPRMDGFEAMKRIRAHDNARIAGLPIVALTAKAMKDDHEKCMQAGASDYLPKPVNMNNLVTVLKVWLAGKEFGA